MSDPWYGGILSCPDCGCRLSTASEGWICGGCGRKADRQSAPVDLLPRRPRAFIAELPRQVDVASLIAALDLAPPEITYSGPTGSRDSRALFSVLPRDLLAGGTFLDLGCGPRDQAVPAAHCGFRYVGVDLFSAAADIRADAHALPFQDQSFDVVFSYAVLEHLHNPFIAWSEVRRVLKPGGVVVGTVSQGEPFHNSFFHHTPWGVVAVAAASGFRVERLWPSTDTLGALATMGHYSRPLRWALAALAVVDRLTPFLAPRRWLQWSERQRQHDACGRAGSLSFTMRPSAERRAG